MEQFALSTFRTGEILFSEMVEHFHGYMKKRAKRFKRDDSRISQDYHHSIWQHTLDEKRWTKFQTVGDYLKCTDASYRVAKIDNRLVRVRTDELYGYRYRLLHENLIKYAGDTDELWELGCGWGHNLFSLAAANRWKKLSGRDISPNGIEAARQTAGHFGLNCMDFGTIDLTNPADPGFGGLRGKTAFTYHCLEQLKHFTPVVLDNLRRAGLRRIIHFEPTTELLRFWSLKDIANYVYVLTMDYQDNLLKNLWKLRDKGQVRIIEQKRFYFALAPRNDYTFIVWEPIL
ncbi:MAG: class I SAM-dependent methyltransferase [Planctomycetes bacterium]|nr:class I SAM-dependent methyltransferase [Planctomycetota bacterium]